MSGNKIEFHEKPVDPQSEGCYRRGYHQAIAYIAFLIKNGQPLTAADLTEWVEGIGMEWRKETSLEYMIVPPDILLPKVNKTRK